MPKPDFFIVGAPRCGTTAMYEYLKEHPDIFMPSFKEPHYFGSDLTGGRFDIFKGREDKYLALFAQAKNEKRIGEASVGYLYSKQAATEIKRFNADSKIIIMLRSPIEAMYSAYYQARYTGTEDIPSFEDALGAEADRRAGKRIPKTADNNFAGLYRERARFAEQVQRYFDVFGHKAVRVIIFDDFIKDVSAVYQGTLSFLDVAPDFQPNFEALNTGRETRSPFVRALLMSPVFLSVGKRFPVVSSRLYSTLKRMNSKPELRPPLDPELRRRLQQELLPEIEQLEAVLGRELTIWKEGAK